MLELAGYERVVLKKLLSGVLPTDTLNAVTKPGLPFEVEHTGVGYFLTLWHKDLPKERLVCDEPMLIGEAGNTSCGFLVFIEGGELMLECHSWGDGEISRDIRESDVRIRESA